MKIGFIGSGNMVSGIISGLLKAPLQEKTTLTLTASSTENAKIKAATLGVAYANSNDELVKQSDIIIIGVKPQILPSVLTSLDKKNISKDKLFISIAAGVTIPQLSEYLLGHEKIVRIMPNMNIRLQKSVSGVCFSLACSSDEQASVLDLFNQLGSTYVLNEKDFVTFTGIAGCSPAFTSLYVDGLSRAAVVNGLPLSTSRDIVIDAMIGTLENLKQTKQEPWDLINQICSPGGTTIRGVTSLEKDGLTSALLNALNATIERDNELSQ